MKNLSKVMAVVLALLMTLSTVSFAAFTDVPEDANYGEAVSILNAMGILKGDVEGTFRPDDTIKRSEFAAVVCRMLGLGEAGEGAKGQVVFTDVSGEHWASGYIALASQQGIVNGKGNGIFDPDADVKYEEAVKMIVAALGYTPMADTNGGYPGGFQIVAAQKGILSGVKGIQGDAASRSLVAQMCYNALEVPLMVQDGFGTEISFGYGDQLLLNKLGVTKFEGTVYNTSASSDDVKEGKVALAYDVQITAIKDQSNASRVKLLKNGVLNEDNQYKCNPVVEGMDSYARQTVLIDDADETLADTVEGLLDYASVMYVKDADTDDEATLVAIAKKGNKNKTVEFRAEDVIDGGTDTYIDATAVGKVTVDTDTKEEKYKLAVTKVYVNGRTVATEDIAADGAIAAIAKGEPIDTHAEMQTVINYYFDSARTADIKLLDGTTGSEELFNTVYITTYSDYVVEEKNDKKYSIVDKNNNGKLILDEENEDYRFTIVKDGAKISFADIQENDVVTVNGYINSDKELEYGTVTVTSQQVSGVVKAYNASEGTVTIDDTVYDIDTNNITIGTTVRLGDTVTMYMNSRGTLVGVDKAQSRGNLNFGFATVIAKNSGISSTFQIRIMNTEGTWKTYDFASKVSFDDAPSVTLNDSTAWATLVGDVGIAAGTPSTTSGSTTFVNKLVGYETNSDGKINKIYFNGIGNNATDDIFYTKRVNAPQYYEATDSLGGTYVDDSTIIFSVDGSIAGNAAVVEDNVSVAKKEALVDRDTFGTILVANEDENGYAKVILGTSLVGKVNPAASFFTIVSDAVTTNAEGDKGTLYTGICGGDEATIFVEDGTTINVADYTAADYTESTTPFGGTLAKGDVIIFSKAANGDAKKVIVLLDASTYATSAGVTNNDAALTVETFSAAGTNYKFIFGYAASLSGNRVGLIDGTVTPNTTAYTDGSLFSIKSGASMTYYDAYEKVGNKVGKVAVADKSDIETVEKDENDKIAATGDVIFARVANDSSIEDVVIIKVKD